MYTWKSNAASLVIRNVGRSSCGARGMRAESRVRYINAFRVRVNGARSGMSKVRGGTNNGVVAGLRYVGQGILGNSVSEPIGSGVVRRRDIVGSLVESTPF